MMSAGDNFFSTKRQVLKNSLHSQISVDFDVVSLKILHNFEFYELDNKKMAHK
jgi:hypothetical protein